MKFPRGDVKVKRVFANLPQAKMSVADFRPVPSAFHSIGGLYRQMSLVGEQELQNKLKEYEND